MPTICNGPFWDTHQFLNSSSPDLTECFQQTALSWVPCVYMLLVIGPYVLYLRASRYYYIKHTSLNIVKTTFVAILMCLCCVDVGASILERIYKDVSHVSRIISPTVQLLAMIMALVLIQLGRRHGARSSGVLFIYWFLQLVVSVIIFQSRARKLSASHSSALSDDYSIMEDGWYHTAWSACFVLIILVQLILASLVEKEYQCCHALDGKGNCPELCASFPSAVSFWWVTGLVIKGYKRDLIRTDLWDLKPSERSSVVVPKFKKNWRIQIQRCCTGGASAAASADEQSHVDVNGQVKSTSHTAATAATDAATNTAVNNGAATAGATAFNTAATATNTAVATEAVSSDAADNAAAVSADATAATQAAGGTAVTSAGSVTGEFSQTDDNIPTVTTAPYTVLPEVDSKGQVKTRDERLEPGSADVDMMSADLGQESRASRNCEAGGIKASGKTYCPKLWLALAKTFYKQFIIGALFKLCHDIFQFLNPLLLEKMIDFVNDSSQPAWLGYSYSALLFVVAFIQSIALHQYFHRCMTVGLSIRTALIAAIYEKSLRLSNGARCESDTGEVVNLMAVDAQRFLELTTYLNTLWSGPLQIFVTLVLLYLILGPSVFAGLLVMLLLIPLNIVITKLIKKIQVDQMKLKDARIKLMSEILSGIKVLKLYAWEASFEEKVNKIREKELRLLRKSAYLQAVASFAWTCAPFMVSVATFAVYVLSSPDNVLDAKKAFVSISLFNILRFPLLMFPALVINMAQAKVALRRIQKFLLNEELDTSSVHRSSTADGGSSIVIENGTFAWDLQKTSVCAITKNPKDRKCCGCLRRRRRNEKPDQTGGSEGENAEVALLDQQRNHNSAVSSETGVLDGRHESEKAVRDEEINNDTKNNSSAAKHDSPTYSNPDASRYSQTDRETSRSDVASDDTIPTNLTVTLQGINLSVRRGSLVAVVGQVGSGKSSLLSAILGEMMKLSGTVSVTGSVAYVSQQAWIQNTTVEMNILFGRRSKDTCYQRIIDACALRPDLDILHAGDQTEIGEKGINLSGGQKQRISLARAVYAQADVYLLDDPLSAVDSHVGKHIFDHVISHGGLLCGKTRILVTHGLRYLPLVDQIVVMDNGKIVEVGCYSDMLKKTGPFARFLRVYVEQQARASSAGQATTAFSDADDLDEDMCKQLTSVVSDSEQLQDCLHQLRKRRGNKQQHSTAAEGESSGPAAEPAAEEMSAAAASWAESRLSASRELISCQLQQDDSCSSSYCGENEELKRGKSGENINKRNEIGEKEKRGLMSKQEEMSSGRVSLSVFKLYMSAVGVLLCLIIIFTHIVNNSLSIGANFWLSDWSNDAVKSATAAGSTVNSTEGAAPGSVTDKRNMRLGVYGALGVGQGLVEMFCSFIMGGVFAVRAARVLHRNIVSSLLHAELSFYDRTPIGRPINRLTNDMAIVDHVIPFTVRSMINAVLGAVVALCIVAFATPLYLTTLLPLIFIYLAVQRLYISTSRQLRRLESVSRSPIYSHFGETLLGAATIRAFRADRRFISESERRVDDSQACYYATIVANRWLALRLEFVGNCLVFFAALFAVIGRHSLSPGMVGLSITYALSVTQVLNWLVRMTSELETNIVAVERIKEYTEVKREAAWIIEDSRPDPAWPERGEIVFSDFTAHYRPDLDPVLHNISCHIKGGEKVGIVGRTGAGKSSMALAILRLIESTEGRISIDDVDISTIGLHDLRSCLTIIPQDPVLFAGSLRMNIDPFDLHTDEQLWSALDGAHLKSFVQSLPKRLEHECSEGGLNLSVGQRQLVCLVRALLRKSHVLILDEATAAVDVETDDLIQTTIREEFKHCTILTIAHRINTIMDYDRIIVLEKGRLVEMDTPQNLLTDRSSLFYSLAQHSGLVK